MAHSEACEIWIEEHIREGLDEGKAPYLIGKELTDMIERIFHTTIPTKTLASRATRLKKRISSNEESSTTTENNSGIQKKPARGEDGKFVEGTAPGPGRRGKYDAPAFRSQAEYFAALAIGQLERISLEDDNAQAAFEKVINWINDKLNTIGE